jgi:hypothetical protein
MGILHEEWRAVVGREGKYEVSNMGQVRSLDCMVVRRLGKPFFRRGRILEGNATGGGGYRTVNVGGGNKYVHHLVLEAFVGPRPRWHEACHRNGIRTDNRLDNLRWDSAQSNQMDRVTHGTSNRGERCGSAKLTELQALEIMASKDPGCQLAQRYGVAQQTICNIRKGRRWTHLKPAGVA